LPERRQENIIQIISEDLKVLRKVKASRTDRSHGGEAARKRGNLNREHILENKNWDHQDLDIYKGVDFKRDILPGMQDISISKI
jgi:hypothetical protein